MTRSDGAVVESHLRRLAGERLARFVEDLWLARGFDVTREGRTVVASSRTESLTVVTLGRGDGGLRSRVSRREDASVTDRDVDVVVAPRGGKRARRTARRADARLFDATDLREMLWYGVDRPHRNALCDRHLGGAPGDLAAPLATRLHDGTRGAARRVAASSAVTAVALLVVSGAVLGVAVLGTSGDEPDEFRGPIDGNGSEDGRAPAWVMWTGMTPGPASTEGGLWSVGDAGAVPGLSRDGISDLAELAAAHDAGLRNRSYTLWLDTYRPYGGDPSAAVAQRDTDVSVQDGRYLVEVQREREDHRTRVATVYYDGVQWYSRTDNGSDPTYGVLANPEPLATPYPLPFDFQAIAVTRYLSTPETNVTDVVRRDGHTYFRVVGTGTPSRIDGVEDYVVTAFVTPDGVVHEADVEATIRGQEGRYHARFGWTYGRFDETYVVEPTWLETGTERGENGTSENGTSENGTSGADAGETTADGS